MNQLPSLHAEMSKKVQEIYRRSLEQALESPSEERRRLVFFSHAEELRAAIFDYPGHSGPAYAAGAGEFHHRSQELARLLALPPGVAEQNL